MTRPASYKPSKCIDDGVGGKKCHWEGSNGKAHLDCPPSALPLYGTERLVARADGSVVIITEGERAAKALNDLNDSRFCAVGLVTGASLAGAWDRIVVPSDDSLAPLKRFQIAVWPDNDEIGRTYMHKVIERIGYSLGLGVDRIRWPEAPEHGDAADFIGSGFRGSAVENLLTKAMRMECYHTLPAPPAPIGANCPWPLGAIAAVAAVAGSSLERPEKPLKPVMSLTADMLPAGLRDWIMDEAESLNVPPEYVAIPAIVAAGILIGRKIAIKPKALGAWYEIPNLWGCVIGEPSRGKSPGGKAGLSLFRQIAQAHRDGHQVADKLSPPNTPATNPPRYETNDATIERLAVLLERDYPRGILVFVEELQGWFDCFDKAGRESDRAFYLAAWDGNRPFNVERMGRPPVDLEAVVVSVCGEIQPDLFRAHSLKRAPATMECSRGFNFSFFPTP